MNLQSIKSTFLLLLFVGIGIASAQMHSSSSVNIINLDLIISDRLNGEQGVTLTSAPEIDVYAGHTIGFNINLKYQSSLANTRYFWFGYSKPIKDARLSLTNQQAIDIPVDDGITAPIIIPPVRKKKVSKDILTSIYPFKVKSDIIPTQIGQRFRVIVVLDEYDNAKDYLLGENGKPSAVVHSFYINVLSGAAFTQESTPIEFSMSTYPNPSIDHLTIQHTYTTPLSAPIQPTPIKVIIYNDQGIFISEHTVASTTTNVNSTLYRIDTTHLVAGTYYFKLIHDGKITVKTVIKQ
ncbi:MAG: T9SS type A sorting domain-containing protein [Bacteroidota bacterium]